MVGKPANIDVRGLVFDDRNIQHLARHGVRPVDLIEVLNKQPRFFENLPGRAATHVMLGSKEQEGYYYYYAPIRPAVVAGMWYAVTGWRLSRRRGISLYSRGRE